MCSILFVNFRHLACLVTCVCAVCTVFHFSVWSCVDILLFFVFIVLCVQVDRQFRQTRHLPRVAPGIKFMQDNAIFHEVESSAAYNILTRATQKMKETHKSNKNKGNTYRIEADHEEERDSSREQSPAAGGSHTSDEPVASSYYGYTGSAEADRKEMFAWQKRQASSEFKFNEDKATADRKLQTSIAQIHREQDEDFQRNTLLNYRTS